MFNVNYMKIQKQNIKQQYHSKLEIKSISTSADENGIKFGYISGYAATFGNMDGNEDILVKGCFDKTLQSGRKVKLLYQHSDWKVIGSVTKLEIDEYGLKFEARINLGVESGSEAHALLEAGDLDSVSIGFSCIDMEYKQNEEGDMIRYIKELALFEVSVVTFPANSLAKVVEVKALEEEIKSITDAEITLRDKGFSKKEAKMLISKIKEFSQSRDGLEKKNEDNRDDCSAFKNAIINAFNKQ